MSNFSHGRFVLFCILVLPLLAACSGRAAAIDAPLPAVAQPAESVPAATPVARAAASDVPESEALPTALPDRLVLPSIDVDTSVVELGWSQKSGANGQLFSQWDEADFAAGWHKNSALPGNHGNIVLSGHNNIKGAVFRELDLLQRGDIAVLYAGDTKYEYSIDQVLIVPEKHVTAEQRKLNAVWIQPTPDDRLTLVSCWPRDDNTHRIIVVAHPLPQAAGASD